MTGNETGPGMRTLALTNRPTQVDLSKCRLPQPCSICRGQLHPDHYAARMRLFEEAAHRFSEQQLGRPYVEFKGRAA